MSVRLVFRRPVCYGYTAIFSVLLSIQTSFMSMYFQRAVAIAAATAAVVVAAHSKHFYTSARTIHLSRSLSHTAKCLHMCFSLLPHYSHRIERLLSVNTLTTNTRTHTNLTVARTILATFIVRWSFTTTNTHSHTRTISFNINVVNRQSWWN